MLRISPETKQAILDAVSQSRLGDALRYLLNESDNFHDDEKLTVNILTSRFSALQLAIRTGTISTKDEQLERNQIIKGLLELIGEKMLTVSSEDNRASNKSAERFLAALIKEINSNPTISKNNKAIMVTLITEVYAKL